jgi:hypothetical protein
MVFDNFSMIVFYKDILRRYFTKERFGFCIAKTLERAAGALRRTLPLATLIKTITTTVFNQAS